MARRKQATRNRPAATRGRGRPALNPGGRPRTITLTDEAWQKAEDDAEVLSGASGIRVSTSQAIDTAVRSFNASKFKQ